MRVPHESSTSAGTYRDHNIIFSLFSFHGVCGTFGTGLSGRNAWAHTVSGAPLMIIQYEIVAHTRFRWMQRGGFNWFLKFAAQHLRNFIWEQAFIFKKVPPENMEEFETKRKGELGEILKEQRLTKG